MPVCPAYKPWRKTEQVEEERCLWHGPLGPTEMSLNQAHRGVELIQSSGIQNLRGLVKNATSWTSHGVRISDHGVPNPTLEASCGCALKP